MSLSIIKDPTQNRVVVNSIINNSKSKASFSFGNQDRFSSYSTYDPITSRKIMVGPTRN